MGIDINSLISAASRKLGVPEEKLRKAVNDGNVSELRSYLSEKDNEKLDKAMRDKKLADEIQKKYMGGRR
ncbi:MAG: hypothetical protein IJU82_04140 [Ruminiclostridium sp.]|nr:hypothetical protein [Ruminiclostridium sp.]